ncbi:MAG: cell division ATP-binding protein FtsE, partial [Massilia sp.]|nr:cell division ATP-binding protein FtsE [Massilia sp.]
AIARAIVNRPQIILADEPTANLDRASADKVLDALRAFHSVGVTCMISTHDETIFDAVLDNHARVIRLDHGQLIEVVSGAPLAPVAA